MLTALHECAVHANMRATLDANPAALGLDRATRDPLYLHAQFLTAEVEKLGVRPIAD